MRDPIRHARNLAVSALLLATSTSAQVKDPPTVESPGPRMLEHLRQRATGRPAWLTTSAGRLRATVGGVGPAGLALRHVAPGESPGPSVAWPEVLRLETIHTRRTSGRVLGLTAGAILCGYLGAAVADAVEPPARNYSDTGAMTGVALGALAGYLVGGRLGARLEHSEFLYARAAPPERLTTGPTDAEHARSSTSAAKPRLRAGQRVRLWVEGNPVEGRVLAADADQVRLENLSWTPGPDGALAPVSWSRIESLDLGTSGAGRGAIVGALVLGALGAAAGATISSVGLSGGGAEVGDVIGGAAGGALLGAGLGAAVGSTFKGWKWVYPGR